MSSEALLYNVSAGITELQSASRLTLGSPLFVYREFHLPRIRPEEPEFGLLRVTSWLYVLYYEMGRVGVDFLIRSYPGGPEPLQVHYERVRVLRTYFEHSLNPLDEHDDATLASCAEWFGAVAGVRSPMERAHWQSSLDALLAEAQEFVSRLRREVQRIDAGTDRSSVAEMFRFRVSRHLPAHVIDAAIADVASLHGRALDVRRMRDRHGSGWVKRLELLPANMDLQAELMRLIENEMLRAEDGVLPISGNDIVTELDIRPGPEVGRLLRMARQEYARGVTSALDLMKYLRLQIASGS